MFAFFKRIRSYTRSIRKRDPAARTTAEVLLCYPAVHAMAFHRLAAKLWHAGAKLPARCLSHIAKVLTGVEIHPAATIGANLFIDHATGVVIGETAEVGDNVTLYHDVTLGGTSTTLPGGDLNREKRHPTLGHEVIVGAGAQVLGPVTVGEHARIGANAVVLSDVLPHTTVVGIPAKPVGTPAHSDTEEVKEADVFHAYGYDPASGRIPDPVANLIRDLSAKVDRLESRLAKEESDENS